ncbi:MAG: FliM/FliN family flagellar motor switch protein [Acidobacteria bacterium]|nr:MAG: FliM/FliN family flagellar motor switch protein [Acidobacteriota bacterium]
MATATPATAEVLPEAAAPPAPAAPEAVAAPAPSSPLDRWTDLQWLPCNLEVKLSVPHFTVGDVLRMAPQSVVETRWQQNADVPVRANGQLLAWAEFEGVDEKLAVRITRLA